MEELANSTHGEQVSIEEIKKIAELTNLHLNEETMDEFQKNISSTISWIGQVTGLSVTLTQ